MKRAFLVFFLSLVAIDAQAISRHTTTAMSCERIKAVVQSEGQAILQWRSTRDPSLPLYGRYVANRQFCQPEERADIAYVPAADAKSCPVRKCVLVVRYGGRSR